MYDHFSVVVPQGSEASERPAARAGHAGDHPAGRHPLATAGTVLGLALPAAAAVALHLDSVPPERPWAAVSFPLVWATPGVLGVLARRRPLLLVPAAVLAALLSVLTLSGVTLVLLVPAGLWAAALWRRPPGWPGRARTALLLASPLLGLAGFWALLAHADPACWEVRQEAGGDRSVHTLPDAECTGTSTIGPRNAAGVTTVAAGFTSDVVVAGEALASALLAAGTVGLAWAAAGRPGPRREPA
jgi:hypothetical protein